MRKSTALFAAAFLCAATSAAYGLYSVAEEGQWPKEWPGELESLREQSRTLEGPTVPQLHYEIPFETRGEFEAAWPHLLKVKSEGAPVFLVRAPSVNVYDLKAGVIVHAPPAGSGTRADLKRPMLGDRREQFAWMWTTYIELVVDGEVVDLNRIPLPAETPIIDRRFDDRRGGAPGKTGG